MRSTRMFLQVTGSAILLVGCLTLSFGLCSPETDKIEPTGTNIGGAIQFDAVIELNRYSPDSLRQDYTMIFARYWVARNYYSVAVVWAEPQSTDMFFTARPGLSMSSNEHSFNVCQQTKTKSTEAHKKPLGERGVFRHKFGGYPIDNIRFAERETLAERIYTDDLRILEDANQGGREVPDLFIPHAEGMDERDVAQVKIQKNEESIDSMQLFNADKKMLKDISYDYENIGGMNYLSKMTAVLPERPMMVGFNGKGIKVTLDGKEYQYRDLEATHHIGARTCTVEYETMELGDKKVTLPVKVTVHNRKNGHILHSVQMMNFKHISMDSPSAEKAAKQFAGFTLDQHTYWQLLEKYWNKDPEQIDDKDTELVKQLIVRTEKDADVKDNSIGEKLKHLNILIELNRIIGNESEIERHYQNYLSTLSDNKLTQMVLVGGYGVIETSMFRQRHSEAEKLLGLWINAASEIKDDESILFFAKSQLAKNRLWTTAKLLENYINKKSCSADDQFKAQALRCIALNKLCKLMSSDDVAKKGLIAKVQINWVESVGKDKLNKMFTDSLNQTKMSFISLPKPTESQQDLRKQLDKIEQEIIQTNKEQQWPKTSI
jgi:hypothetical protein